MKKAIETTDATTGLSDKDIKSIAKYSSHDLSKTLWVYSSLCGFDARLAVMLDAWHPFLTQAVGTTIPTLLSSPEPTRQPPAALAGSSTDECGSTWGFAPELDTWTTSIRLLSWTSGQHVSNSKAATLPTLSVPV
jgi:hypothetical protein